MVIGFWSSTSLTDKESHSVFYCVSLVKCWDQVYLAQSEKVCWTTSHLLFCDILQPREKPDFRYWGRCTWWGFTNEPEPSETKVSPAIFVVLLMQCAVTVALFQARTMLRERVWWHLQCFLSCSVIPNTHYIIYMIISTSSHVMVMCL